MLSIILSGLLIIVGAVVLGLGLWIVAKSRDPLGYVPPSAPLIPLTGLAMLVGGLLWRLA